MRILGTIAWELGHYKTNPENPMIDNEGFKNENFTQITSANLNTPQLALLFMIY